MFSPRAHSLMFCCWLLDITPWFSSNRLLDIHRCCSDWVRMACKDVGEGMKGVKEGKEGKGVKEGKGA